ncbi:MAG: amino acid permease, partial [Planctomycetota bacterium]
MSDTNSAQDSQSPAVPKRQLTLFDSTCIIVGIIIGAGIYESTPLIASNVTSTGWLILAWSLGGFLSLLGALCYAELATAYPKQGGDYVYLTRAFGRAPGFLFAWAQIWIVRPGSIGAMAYVFARYANQLWPLSNPLARLHENHLVQVEWIRALVA